MSVNDISSITDSHCREIDDLDVVVSSNSTTLYGRSSETKQLLEVYERVVVTHSQETVVIHGESGSGKSALVTKLRETVCERHGYFVGGKYNQNCTIHEDFSAIVAALSDLCDLISQSTEEHKEQIRKALGDDVHVLVHTVSGLSFFLDEGSEAGKDGVNGSTTPVRYEDAFSKFKIACKTFLKVMANSEHPVVLVLDDIQWMDLGSRQLIELLLDDTELRSLLLILVHRDEESDAVTDLFKDRRQEIVDIPVRNLDVDAVTDMILAYLSADRSQNVKDLGRLVDHRTGGNPFHVLQFLDYVVREEYLVEVKDVATDDDEHGQTGRRFFADYKSWKFDVEDIRESTSKIDSLVQVLASKIQRLHPSVQEALKIASLLGFTFREDVLTDVVNTINPSDGDDSATVKPALGEGVKLGLIEATKRGYQFCHDKLQAWFRDMVGPEEKLRLHEVIGREYMSRKEGDSKYFAALHLNIALSSSQEAEQSLVLAKLNLDAAKYCHDRSAFPAAADLLQSGLEIIPDNEKWTTHGDLTLKLMIELSKVQCILSKFEDSIDSCNEVLRYARTDLDRVNALSNKAGCFLGIMDLKSASPSVSAALSILGVKWPKRVTDLLVLRKVIRVKMLLAGKSDEHILGLPLVDNKVTSTIFKVVIDQSLVALMTEDESTFVYSSLLLVELTLRHGLSVHASLAFAAYSFSEFFLGNFRRAYRFGLLTTRLAGIYDSKGPAAAGFLFVVTNVTHFRSPVQDVVRPIEDVTAKCCDDMRWYAYGAGCTTWYGLFMGENLNTLKAACHEFDQRLNDHPSAIMRHWLKPCYQYILNLHSHAIESGELSGEIIIEREFLEYARAMQDNYCILYALLFKAQQCFHYADFHGLYKVVEELEPLMITFRSDLNFISWLVFASLAYYEQYRRCGKRSSLRSARKYGRKLRSGVLRECPNAIPFVPLLNAEDMSVTKSDCTEVAAAYQAAAAAAMREQWIHVAALAHERAGFVLCSLERGLPEAKSHFAEAQILYGRWGAYAKRNWLRSTSAQKLSLDTETGVIVGTTVSGESQQL